MTAGYALKAIDESAVSLGMCSSRLQKKIKKKKKKENDDEEEEKKKKKKDGVAHSPRSVC